MKLKFDKHADLYPVPHGLQLTGGNLITDVRGVRYLVLDRVHAEDHSLQGYVINLGSGRLTNLSDLSYPIYVERHA